MSPRPRFLSQGDGQVQGPGKSPSAAQRQRQLGSRGEVGGDVGCKQSDEVAPLGVILSSKQEGQNLASVSQKLASIFVGPGCHPPRIVNNEMWYPEEGGDALGEALA